MGCKIDNITQKYFMGANLRKMSFIPFRKYFNPIKRFIHFHGVKALIFRNVRSFFSVDEMYFVKNLLKYLWKNVLLIKHAKFWTELKEKRGNYRICSSGLWKKRLALFSHKKGLKQLKVPIINMGVQKYLNIGKWK